MRIAFFGLGNMGNPIAMNLLKSGEHELSVFDLDEHKGQNLIAQGASWIEDVSQSIAEADVLMSSLPGPKQIAAFANEHVFPAAKPELTWIELSTNNLPPAKCSTHKPNHKVLSF